MRFGLCTEIDNLQAAQELGFDYIEVNASALAALSDEEFEQKLAAAKSVNIGCECFNVLFPKAIALLGQNATAWNEIEAYLHHTFRRIKALGGKIVVFGSGQCRSYPHGMSFYDAHRRLTEIVAKMGALADGYGLSIAVEPLNHTESNMIRTTAEGAMLVAQVNAKNVVLLADGYHMFVDNEPLENIQRIGGLAHTHIAARENRRYPTVRDERLAGFFAQLHAIGYDERVSIEGGTDNFVRDAPIALAVLRGLAQECKI